MQCNTNSPAPEDPTPSDESQLSVCSKRRTCGWQRSGSSNKHNHAGCIRDAAAEISTKVGHARCEQNGADGTGQRQMRKTCSWSVIICRRLGYALRVQDPHESHEGV